jgi:hypothetical protein
MHSDRDRVFNIVLVATGWPAFAGHDNPWVTNKGRWYDALKNP